MAQAENQTEVAQLEFELEGVEPQDVSVTTGHETEPVEGGTSTETKPDEIADLRRQLEESNRLRADAESRVTSLSAEKSASESRLATEVNGRFAAHEQAISTRAASAKTAIATIKTEMVRAQAEQRYEDFADLQEKMSEAKLAEDSASRDAFQLKQHKDRVAAELEAANSRPRDPVDAFLANIPGDRSRQWLRDHPEILKKVASSASEAKLLYGYAQVAEGKGHPPDSAGYFDSIEQQFGLKEPDQTVTQQTERQTKPAPKDPGQTANAAPSSRQAMPSQTTRRVTLDDVVRKLTASDRNNAKISFPDKTQDEAEKLYAQGLVISKQREPGFRPDIRL